MKQEETISLSSIKTSTLVEMLFMDSNTDETALANLFYLIKPVSIWIPDIIDCGVLLIENSFTLVDIFNKDTFKTLLQLSFTTSEEQKDVIINESILLNSYLRSFLIRLCKMPHGNPSKVFITCIYLDKMIKRSIFVYPCSFCGNKCKYICGKIGDPNMKECCYWEKNFRQFFIALTSVTAQIWNEHYFSMELYNLLFQYTKISSKYIDEVREVLNGYYSDIFTAIRLLLCPTPCLSTCEKCNGFLSFLGDNYFKNVKKKMDSQQYDYYNQGPGNYSPYSMQMPNTMQNRPNMMPNMLGVGLPHQQMGRFTTMSVQQPRNMMNSQSANSINPQARMNPYASTVPRDRVSPPTINSRTDIPMNMAQNPNRFSICFIGSYGQTVGPEGAPDYDDYMVYNNFGSYPDDRAYMMNHPISRVSSVPRTVAYAPLNNGAKYVPRQMVPTRLSPQIQRIVGIGKSAATSPIVTPKDTNDNEDIVSSLFNIPSTFTTPEVTSSPSTSNEYTLSELISLYNAKNIFAVGTDYSQIGIFNSTNSDNNYLYKRFPSPWSGPVESSPSFYILPACYSQRPTPIVLFTNPKSDLLPYLTLDTKDQPPSLKDMDDTCLLYLFYAFPKDLYQLVASFCLYKRGYVYHKQQQKWYKYSSSQAASSSLVVFEEKDWKFISVQEQTINKELFMDISEIMACIQPLLTSFDNQE
ncbi:hypothetical protein WA158_004640 [Blastocystis sp. Blastoise]